MKKSTVYLPDDLKAALERVAATVGRSEAELVREGVRLVTEAHAKRAPTIPLFSSGIPDLAERVDEELEGFGGG